MTCFGQKDFLTAFGHMVPTVGGSQGKSGNIKSTRVRKLTKMQKKLERYAQTSYNSSIFFLLASLPNSLFFYF